MRYLVTTKKEPPFLTHVFDEKNHFVKGMLVCDLAKEQFTKDGIT